MKSICTLLAAALLGGCASLDTAGHAAYTVKAVTTPEGKVTGYELAVKDGKEFEARQISFHAKGDLLGISIVEGESKAFKGQGIAAKAASVLPVTNLQELVR
ncbi:MAG TPA: hypothetical protein VLJ86_20125 [Ramlibacter sp.]|nr:hypothetical protein [Ramlibacter sp.]